jgi:hypothetical protein
LSKAASDIVIQAEQAILHNGKEEDKQSENMASDNLTKPMTTEELVTNFIPFMKMIIEVKGTEEVEAKEALN